MGIARIIRRRPIVALAAVACASWLGACGGGGASGGSPAAPAAAIDPSSDNAVTGPVNRARAAADAQEAHDRQIDQAVDGQP
ncbi:MAG TPA: hypothetical protein VHM89_15845 [Acidimicrobiales bacterium]|nr:hypothetical protein [Acidimicrobiales bacterium]